MLILYDYDSNLIWAEPMKNWSDTEALRACKALFQLLNSSGIHPKLHRLDNEASKTLQLHLSNIDTDFQLTPASMH